MTITLQLYNLTGKLVSSWISMSCQLHRVIAGEEEKDKMNAMTLHLEIGLDEPCQTCNMPVSEAIPLLT